MKTIREKLIKLVLPITFQNFMLALVSASDAVMLGKLDQNMLSAVSLAAQITFVFHLFMAAITMGMNILVAQYWGKGDFREIEKIVGYVMKITLLISAAFFLAAVLAPGVLMRIFTGDGELIGHGVRYLRIVGISYILTGVTQIFMTVLKNVERASYAMWISGITVVLNILLNAVLIFGLCGGPALQVSGAALATSISSLVGLLLAAVASVSKTPVRTRMKEIIGHYEAQQFWKYTLPVLINELAWGGGFTMYSVILGHMGTDAVAANSLANITKNLLICFCMGLGAGASILVGNELGAGRLEEAKRLGGYLTKLSIISGLVTGAVILVLSPVIVTFAGISDTASHYLRAMLIMSSYYVWGKAINCMTIGGIFAAGGDSKFGMVCDTVTLWCVTVPLGAIAAFILHMPVIAVYFVLNLDEVIKLPAVYMRYKKYKWVRNLTEEKEF